MALPAPPSPTAAVGTEPGPVRGSWAPLWRWVNSLPPKSWGFCDGPKFVWNANQLVITWPTVLSLTNHHPSCPLSTVHTDGEAGSPPEKTRPGGDVCMSLSPDNTQRRASVHRQENTWLHIPVSWWENGRAPACIRRSPKFSHDADGGTYHPCLQ